MQGRQYRSQSFFLFAIQASKRPAQIKPVRQQRGPNVLRRQPPVPDVLQVFVRQLRHHGQLRHVRPQPVISDPQANAPEQRRNLI